MNMMDRSTVIEVPVLIIGFNRPDVIRQCIAKLRESKPTSIYLACDGPRKGKENEDALVREVRSIMENEIDWECNKHFRYNEENKGCEVTESEAITWVLSENEYVIVVEDDIIAPYSFLKFAQDMLYRYRENDSVYQITSDNVTPIQLPNNEDYCFSIYGHIWGWATWKRAWDHFDLYVHDFENTLSTIDSREDLTNEEKKHFKKLCIQLIKEDAAGGSVPKHTWDIVWSYIKWRDGGLTIVPRVHLSSNVGVVGLHSQIQTVHHFRPYEEEFEAVCHPKEIKRSLEYDKFHYSNFLREPPYLIRQWKRGIGFIKRKLRKD